MSSFLFFKKTKLFLLLGFMLAFGSSIAQSNNLKFSLMSSPSRWTGGYERQLTNHFSLVVSYHAYNYKIYDGKRTLLFQKPKITYRNDGFRIAPELRIYFLSQKKLNGFYLAPVFAFGRHRLAYTKKVKDRSYGNFGSGLLGLTLSLASSTPPQYQTGFQRVKANEMGIKLGYQKRWSFFSLDGGIHIARSNVRGESSTVILDNGWVMDLEREMAGLTTSLYAGLGIAF